ncbi:protein-glutamate O-methyltransferase CheR [Aliiglaciecola sp. CAU 1673]|uniref:CheR family methyltransferase n=1 Tax=Aliiglaciecola sp. CAU 1673 TaxID=3032595 RepID=UPI0023D9D78B|nr:protein-glutamate O-methyltransferase CheR [Aliiglaciecola sp. CAU 1673]MDF2178240.1 protein-glutamate O-methyltransferase CheR [Aliiglaciecola sp. CAU 1673]
MNDEVSLSRADHQRIADYIGRHTGIQLPDHKRQLIETRLRKRLKATGKASISEYLDYAFSPEESGLELVLLVDALTTNKTDFFREANHFEALRDFVFHGVSNGQRWHESPFRIWSAACSSGEEPYTLAIVLWELAEQIPGFRFVIDASDISTKVLDHAMTGIYDVARIDPVPEYLRKKYFLRSQDPAKRLIKMSKQLREVIRFFSFNLITGDYGRSAEYDVIFCRNVMIYFCDEDRAKVIRSLRGELKPNGLLILGHSESIGNQREGFEPVAPTVYRKVEA